MSGKKRTFIWEVTLCGLENFLCGANVVSDNVNDSELATEIREQGALRRASLGLIRKLVHYLLGQLGHPQRVSASGISG